MIDRSLQYAIIKGWADPKNLPSIQKWWPIAGETVKKFRLPSRQKILKWDNTFRSILNRKKR